MAKGFYIAFKFATDPHAFFCLQEKLHVSLIMPWWKVNLLQLFIWIYYNPFLKPQIIDFFKLTEFADENFKFDESGGKFSETGKMLWENEKLLVMINFSFSHSVFKSWTAHT